MLTLPSLGVEIDLSNLRKIKKPNFSLFTHDMFLVTCIISGCDYLDSAKGIGFVKAQKLVEQCGEIDTVSVNYRFSSLKFHEVLSLLREEPKVEVPDDYEENFKKAFLTFKFQRVYCPLRKKLVMLNE